MNKKQMKQMERQMKKMGMKMEELEGVREVIIRFDEKELIIDKVMASICNTGIPKWFLLSPPAVKLYPFLNESYFEIQKTSRSLACSKLCKLSSRISWLKLSQPYFIMEW